MKLLWQYGILDIKNLKSNHMIKKLFIPLVLLEFLIVCFPLTAGEAMNFASSQESYKGDDFHSSELMMDGDWEPLNLSSEEVDDECCSECPCNRFFLNADYLYWRAFEEDLNGCGGLAMITETDTPNGGLVTTTVTKSKNPNFKWNSGYRIGAGLEFKSCWDASLYYTHFHTDAKRSLSHLNDIGTKSSERLHWKLHYDTVDFILGRRFTFCDFSLKPFLGLRDAEIDQHVRLNSKVLGAVDGTPSFFNLHRRTKQDFWGVGPFFGLKADWDVGCNFGLFGCIDAGLLYGRFDLKTRSAGTFDVDQSILRERRRLNTCTTFVDAALGISWQYCFCNKTVLKFKAAAEHHRYFDQNRIFGNQGDLYFDGGSFSGTYEF